MNSTNTVWLLIVLILVLYVFTNKNNNLSKAWAGFTGKEGA